MTSLSICGATGNLLPYSRYLLEALAFFPDDDLSHSQLFGIIASEYDSWLAVGSEKYVPSKVSQILVDAANKRTSRVHVCGLVALAMFGLHCVGKRASQESAKKLVADFTAQQNKHPFEFYDAKSNETAPRGIRLTSDPASIGEIFREYRSVAHICAARVVSFDYLEPLRPFDPTPEADQCFLSTAVALQGFFAGEMGMENWRLRHVEFPEDLIDATVPFDPTTGLMEGLLGIDPQEGEQT